MATMTQTHTTQFNSSFSLPSLLLRVEGLALFLGAIAAYVYRQENGWVFLALLFTPDLSMIGYLVNTKVGALTYNLVHTYALPMAMLAVGLVFGVNVIVPVALIWLAHIGMDRTVGYGLKYATSFKDTHLQHI